MKVLLLDQAFYPDVVAVAQYASDLSRTLAARGHEVTVVASQRGYDDSSMRFQRRQTWHGVQIVRVLCTGFGKGAKWRRAADFATFLGSCCIQLMMLRRSDLVVSMTAPPLLSVIAALFAWLWGGRLVVWVMDLNPDEAIAIGWLPNGSVTAKFLEALLRFSLRRAENIVVLDRFMKDRIAQKGIAPKKVAVIPPWSHDAAVRYDPAGRQTFRREHGLEGKYVVMYSGNHSPCHPLKTLPRGGSANSWTAGDCLLLRRWRQRVRKGTEVCGRAESAQHRVRTIPTAGEAFGFVIGGGLARGGDGRCICRDRTSLQDLQHPVDRDSVPVHRAGTKPHGRTSEPHPKEAEATDSLPARRG